MNYFFDIELFIGLCFISIEIDLNKNFDWGSLGLRRLWICHTHSHWLRRCFNHLSVSSPYPLPLS